MTNEEAIHVLNNLIQMLEEHNPESDHIKAFEKAIAALRNQQEWIPCSEGLPKDDFTVLCTYVDGDVFIGSYDFTEDGKREWNDEG